MTEHFNDRLGGDCYPRVSCLGQWIPEAGGGADPVPIISRTGLVTQDPLEWAEYDDLDQDGDPSCCLFACGNALQFFLSLRHRAKSDLDPRKAWIECTGGRGGYAIDAALVYLMNKGMPTKDGSARLVVTEAFDCGSVEAVWSGVQRGDPVVFGHFVPGGHAECGLRVTVEGSKILLDTRGSWGQKAYDRGGYHFVTESDLAKGIPSFGAFAIREVELRPVDVVGPDAQ